jgi:hypothetical protein
MMHITKAEQLWQPDIPIIQQEVRDNQVTINAQVHQSILSAYTKYPFYLVWAKPFLLHKI